MPLPTGFSPNRVYLTQDGQLVVPFGAQIITDGGTPSVLSEVQGEAAFPQILSPTIFRWQIGNDNQTFNTTLPYNFYFLDAWFLKTGGAGGVNDRVSLQGKIPDQQTDPFLTFASIELDGVAGGDIARLSAMADERPIDGYGDEETDIPVELQMVVVKSTGDVSGALCMMIMPFLGNQSFLVGT